MSQKKYYFDQYQEKYNELLEQIRIIFEENNSYTSIIDNLKNEDNDKKWERGLKFSSKIEPTTMFNYFIKGKIKLFSSKKDITHIISTSLFGSDLPLKKVFNNRSFDTKKILWDYLHLLVLFTENSKENKDTDKLEKIINSLSEETSKKNN